jgi:hypothetical protein
VCLNNQPPCASIALRSPESCAASATRIAVASASHRRVEPSTSVNKNVTTPEGAAATDTPAECHTEQQNAPMKLQLKACNTAIERRDLPRDHRARTGPATYQRSATAFRPVS